MKKKQNGFLLLEVLISIGVLAIISLGAFILFAEARQQAKAQEALELTTDYLKGARVFFSSGDFTQVNDATVIANQIAPRAMISGAQLVHPYGGRFSVGSQVLSSVTYMRAVFSNIANSEDCSDIARTLDAVSFHVEIFSSEGVFMGAPKNQGGVLNKANLGTFCSQVVPGQGVVQITFPR